MSAKVNPGAEVCVRGFGELEAVVMDRVWEHGGPVTVRELFDELRRERAIAYTVMSTMDNLHRKGWLARDKDGKVYRYALPSLSLASQPLRCRLSIVDMTVV